MNIPSEILIAADSLGLGACATGGGCDFIIKPLSGERTAVLSSQEAGGECPDTLDEPSTVVIHFTPEWNDEFIAIPFPSAQEAMNAMAKIEHHEC